MGISLSVVMATDERIRSFVQAPESLDGIVAAHGPDECYLADYWDGLHYLLTGDAGAGELPLSALKRGTVAFVDVDDPTHAIDSATVAALTEVLQGLGASDLRKHFDPPAMLIAGEDGRAIYPSRYWGPRASPERMFGELVFHFEKYREFVARAADEGKGLVFCRYEDW